MFDYIDTCRQYHITIIIVIGIWTKYYYSEESIKELKKTC